MNDNVIQLFPVQEEPHIAGEAHCVRCKHTWVSVAVAGTVWMKCPECESTTGLFNYQCEFSEGTLMRECNCGNQLFYLTPDGHLCPNCGVYQQY